MKLQILEVLKLNQSISYINSIVDFFKYDVTTPQSFTLMNLIHTN